MEIRECCPSMRSQVKHSVMNNGDDAGFTAGISIAVAVTVISCPLMNESHTTGSIAAYRPRAGFDGSRMNRILSPSHGRSGDGFSRAVGR